MEKDSTSPTATDSSIKYLIGIIIVLVLALGAFSYLKNGSVLPASGKAATVTMIMKDESYEPQNLEIKKGTEVIFKNDGTQGHWPASDIHPTHGIYPEFDPKQPVNPGDSWSFVFDKVGKWRYHDHLVPSTRGTITVTE